MVASNINLDATIRASFSGSAKEGDGCAGFDATETNKKGKYAQSGIGFTLKKVRLSFSFSLCLVFFLKFNLTRDCFALVRLTMCVVELQVLLQNKQNSRCGQDGLAMKVLE
jgi:hypothetical protein